MHPESYQGISSALLGKIRAGESSSWLHSWPFFIWGHGGLFFPGWLWLSTWPHKDRQRWLSYANTCWGIAPLTQDEIFPDEPNVSAGITARGSSWNNLFSYQAHAVYCMSASCLIEDHHTRCLLQSTSKQKCFSFFPWGVQTPFPSEVEIPFPWKTAAPHLWFTNKLCEMGSGWLRVVGSSFSISPSPWLIVNTSPSCATCCQLKAVSYLVVPFCWLQKRVFCTGEPA